MRNGGAFSANNNVPRRDCNARSPAQDQPIKTDPVHNHLENPLEPLVARGLILLSEAAVCHHFSEGYWRDEVP